MLVSSVLSKCAYLAKHEKKVAYVPLSQFMQHQYIHTMQQPWEIGTDMCTCLAE